MLLIYCWFFVFVVRDILIHVTNFSFGVSRSLRRNGNWTLCYENVTFAGFFRHFSYAYHLPHSRLTYSLKLSGNSARKRPGWSSDTALSLEKRISDILSSLTGWAYTILVFQHSSSHTTPLTIFCFRSLDIQVRWRIYMRQTMPLGAFFTAKAVL